MVKADTRIYVFSVIRRRAAFETKYKGAPARNECKGELNRNEYT